ncbi:MAG: hypothetical protein J6A79_13970 [Clostridia bacterium]|nr:hypothetical protein [Clostridia bacterium]
MKIRQTILLLLLLMLFFPFSFAENVIDDKAYTVLDIEQLCKSEGYRYVGSEFKSAGPHLSICEMESELIFDSGIKLSYAMAAQTINSEKVGNTVTVSLSINYNFPQSQENRIDGWDVYINQLYAGTATVLTEMDQGRMVNFTMTEKYSDLIESIVFISKRKDGNQLISVCLLGDKQEFQPATSASDRLE